ncbi:MAG: hypothetical protein RL701_6311 [Pseudomonadota bacterium]
MFGTPELSTRTTQLLSVCALVFASCASDTGVDDDSVADVTQSEQALSLLPKTPPELAVPAGNFLGLYRKGVGVQIYVCNAVEAGFAWTLKAPEADLLFPGKRVVGSHYAGPTWEARDGSTVVGSRLAGVTVDATAIPWILLQASSHSGRGVMSRVSYIQRLNTQEGLAPTSGCNAETVGTTTNSHYTADYFFYYPIPKRS